MRTINEYRFTHSLVPQQVAARQRDPHPHQAVIDPTGEFMLVADLGADVVHVFRIGPGSQRFQGVVDIALPPGSGPRHLAFARIPLGRGAPGEGSEDDGCSSPSVKDYRVMLYVVTELSNKVHGLRVDYPFGSYAPRFTPVFETSTHGPGGAADTEAAHTPAAADPALPVPAGAAAAEILVSPDSRFLILSSRFDPVSGNAGDDDIIATFAIKPSTGELEALPAGGSIASAGGRNPRHMSLSADGTRLAVALQSDDVVAILERDPASGRIGGAVAKVKTAAQPVAVVWDEWEDVALRDVI
jgi:6-phosphogluconolactonase (cycloisomerase 2 family)